MRSFLLSAILSTAICVSAWASAATFYVDGSVSSSGDGASWETALKTIQEGIDASSDGDTVTVAEGVYLENIRFNGKNITLTSTDPLDPSVVTNTIIDGNRSGSVVTFSGTETQTCVLSGFTIRNGETWGYGGGICGGAWDAHTHATITNNTITGNSAGHGGGLAWCDGTIENDMIMANSARYGGGGLHDCGGTIHNNMIMGNSAPDGGGLHYCDGMIRNNTVTGNLAEWGGGVAFCHGLIQNNTIADNWAEYGGGGVSGCSCTIENNTITGNSAARGGGLHSCNVTIQNNMIIGNSAAEYGGGLAWCPGTIQNNTITGNSAEWGGGLCGCNGTIENNTITANSAAECGGGLHWCPGTIQNNTIAGNWAQAYGGGLDLCDGTIQNNTVSGNHAGESGGGLYRCNGTIRNCIIWANTAPTGPQLYESITPTYSCIEGWTGDYKKRNISDDPRFAGPDTDDFRLLPSSPSIDAGYNDPALPATDIAGMHRIMFGGKSLTVDMGAYEFHIWPPTENVQTGEVTLKWSSLAGKTYSVYQSSDMFTWDVLAEDVASAGDTVTTWVDPPAPVLPPGVQRRYYKIAENPLSIPYGQ